MNVTFDRYFKIQNGSALLDDIQYTINSKFLVIK